MTQTVVRRPTTVRQVWNFVRHFLEMCIAMCVGGSALNALVFVIGPAVVGYPDLRATVPGLAVLLVSVIYTLPMAAWMRFRGMQWRPIAEMSAAMVGLAVLFVALAAVNVLSSADLQHWALAFCGPACIVMLPVMLLRLDMYTGGRARSSVV